MGFQRIPYSATFMLRIYLRCTYPLMTCTLSPLLIRCTEEMPRNARLQSHFPHENSQLHLISLHLYDKVQE